MYIKPAKASTHEAMSLDEGHHFLIFDDWHGWQSSEQLQDLRAANYRTACQFADDKWMALNVLAMKQRHQPKLAMAQVLHPDRGIYQHQWLSAGE
jgi:hypothetical protein